MANDKPICNDCNAPENVAPWGEHFCGKDNLLGGPVPDFEEGQWITGGTTLHAHVDEKGQLVVADGAPVEGPAISDEDVLTRARELFPALDWSLGGRESGVTFEGCVEMPRDSVAQGIVVHRDDAGSWIADACPNVLLFSAADPVTALQELKRELEDLAEAAASLLGAHPEPADRIDRLEPKAGDLVVWTMPSDGWPSHAQLDRVASKLPKDVQLAILPNGSTLQLLNDAMLAAAGLQRIPPTAVIDAPLECVLCGDLVSYDDAELAAPAWAPSDPGDDPVRANGPAHADCARMAQSLAFSDHRDMLRHSQECACELCTRVKTAVRTRLRPRRICLNQTPHDRCGWCKFEAPTSMEAWPSEDVQAEIRDGEDSSSACARACGEDEELQEAGWTRCDDGTYTRRGWTVEIHYLGDRVHTPDTWIGRRPEGGTLQGGWPSAYLACKAVNEVIDRMDREEVLREAGDPAQPLPPDAPMAVLVSQFLLALPGCETESTPTALTSEKPRAGDLLLVKVSRPWGRINVQYVRAHDGPLDGPLGWRFVTTRDSGRYSDPLTTVQRAVDELQRGHRDEA